MFPQHILPDERYMKIIKPIFSWPVLQNGRALAWMVLQSG